MEILGFNIDDGYPEAIVRGLRKGFLKEDTYTALKSCTNLSDFKLVLEDTDYGNYIAGEGDLEPVALKNKLKEKLAKELEHIIA
jgi:V-type H+-transporting ATPase subunit d